ncbi:MAG TPA: FtsQ-type POTRA domain-containing protein [Paenibacillus sp.]|jgi:cell division protein FtsQ
MIRSHIPVLKEKKPKKMKTSRKIIIILMFLFIALLAVLFFRSPISQISEINFQGNTFTTRDQLLQQGKVAVGDQFFGVSTSILTERLEGINSIKLVKVDKQFPGTIHVQIEEYPTVAYELGTDGVLEAILSNGALVSVGSSGIAVEKPILTQWSPDDPNKIRLSQVLGQIPNQLTSDISEIIPSPTTSFSDRIKIYTRSGFEVITAISLLSDKVEYLNQVIETQEAGLITMLEADTYESFPSVKSEVLDEEGTTNE